MTKKRKAGKRLPHYRVYTRLGPSRIHGVGVFAIGKIKKGTLIFYGDDGEIVWVRKTRLRGLPKEIRRLYEDFCIVAEKGRVYGCPRNFNSLTVAWFLNSSPCPNVRCDRNYRFFALRDIKQGAELTVDYATYNQFA
jgi:SET domain-containing protein